MVRRLVLGLDKRESGGPKDGNHGWPCVRECVLWVEMREAVCLIPDEVARGWHGGRVVVVGDGPLSGGLRACALR